MRPRSTWALKRSCKRFLKFFNFSLSWEIKKSTNWRVSLAYWIKMKIVFGVLTKIESKSPLKWPPSPLYPLEKWFFLLDFRLSDTANSSSDVCDFDNKFEQSSAGTARKVRQLIGNGRRMRMLIRMRILVQSILRSWNCFRFVNGFHCIVAINMATISGSFRTKHTIKWGNKK